MKNLSICPQLIYLVNYSFAWYADALTRETSDYEINGFANESEPDNKGRLSNSDLETDNYSLGGSFIGDRVMIGFGYNRLDTDYGIPGAKEGDVRIDLKQYRYEDQVETFNPIENIESVILHTTFNNYRHFEVLEGEVETTFDNEELESRLEVINDVNENIHNAFGFQYNDRDFSAVGEEAFIQPLNEKCYGLFAISHFHNNIKNLNLNRGLPYSLSIKLTILAPMPILDSKQTTAYQQALNI